MLGIGAFFAQTSFGAVLVQYNFASLRPGPSPSTRSTTIFSAAHYFQFSLTPATGTSTLNLTNLTFAFNISATGAASNSSFQLRYNDLSGIAFDNLSSGTTFRIDVKDSGQTASNASVRIDDIIVNGSVDPIPEPPPPSSLCPAFSPCCAGGGNRNGKPHSPCGTGGSASSTTWSVDMV